MHVTFHQQHSCDAVIFSCTYISTAQRFSSFIAAHLFIVPGISATNYFPSLFLVLSTKDFISFHHHINTEQLLFRSWCQRAVGTPDCSSRRYSDYLSALTQLPYSPCLWMLVCYDVKFCFLLSQGGQGVSTFSPWGLSEGASHKLYLCSFLCFSCRQATHHVCWWNI